MLIVKLTTDKTIADENPTISLSINNLSFNHHLSIKLVLTSQLNCRTTVSEYKFLNQIKGKAFMPNEILPLGDYLTQSTNAYFKIKYVQKEINSQVC